MSNNNNTNTNTSNVNYKQPDLKVIVDNVKCAVDSVSKAKKLIAHIANNSIQPDYSPIDNKKYQKFAPITNVDFNFPIDTKKKKEGTSNVGEIDSVVEALLSDLKAISEAGKYADKEKIKFSKREQSRAVGDLAKIIGIHDKYFKGAPAHQVHALMEALREKFKVGNNKKTTAFHLLSRQYRDNDTRQASADAKILNYAYDLKNDESTFAEWVMGIGGLNMAKEKANQYAKEQVEKNDPSPYRLPTPAKQKALFRRMEESVAEIAKGQQTLDIFSIKKSKLPDMFGTLRPYAGHYWRVFVVKVEEGVDDEGYQDDELHFHALYSTVPQNDRLFKGTRLDLKGTSDSTWPEWMLKKPEEPEKPGESEKPAE